MVDFASLVNVQAETIERPKPLPAGSYTALIEKQEFGTTSEKQTPYCRYLFKPTQAQDDVDATALAEVNLSKISLRQDYWLTPDAVYRLKEFLEKTLGIESTGKTIGEMIPQAVGQQVLINVKHSIDRKGEVRAEIASIAQF